MSKDPGFSPCNLIRCTAVRVLVTSGSQLLNLQYNTLHQNSAFDFDVRRYLEGQILWRDFYYLSSAGTPNYDKMEGNRICRQIPWYGGAS